MHGTHYPEHKLSSKPAHGPKSHTQGMTQTTKLTKQKPVHAKATQALVNALKKMGKGKY